MRIWTVWLAGLCLLCLPADTRGAEDLDFGGQAQRLAKTYLQKFGAGYEAQVDNANHLLYVSALDQTHLKQTSELLGAYADAQRKTLLAARPAWNITVILPTVQDYRKLAPAPNVTGFYRGSDRAIVSVDRCTVLLHEFTHALHHADAPRQAHAIWVCEGLATLFESAQIGHGALTPQLDGRLPVLQKAVKDKTVLGLEAFMKLPDEDFAKNASLCYAQARYFMFYLHSKGKLGEFYRTYKETFDEDPSGIQAVQKVLGERLYVIEPQWLKWVSALHLDESRSRRALVLVGLEVTLDDQGVKVVKIQADSPAAKAKRVEVGDVIYGFNGRTVSNLAEYVGAVHSAEAGQTATIDLRRNGREMTIRQPIGTSQ